MNLKRRPLLLLAIALLALASCKSSPKPGESVSNINHALQDSVVAFLEKSIWYLIVPPSIFGHLLHFRSVGSLHICIPCGLHQCLFEVPLLCSFV